MRYPALGLTMAVLESLFKNDVLCREFPFIGFAKRTWSANGSSVKTGCSSCSSRPSREYRQHILETVKAGIVGMPPERLAKLKDLLNTDKLVLHFAVRGKTITKEL